MTDARATQAPALVLAEGDADLRALQGATLVLASVGSPARVTQAPTLVLGSVIAPTQVFQAPVLVLASGVPCATRWTHAFTITRTDGEVFRFTSLDRDLEWGGETFKACGAPSPSASENAAEVGSVGNMELRGTYEALGFTEADLHAGLFNGAYVEDWLVAWEGTESPRLQQRGTLGKVEHGPNGFRAELLGDGAKLQQTPLVTTIKPECRWTFGDARCGVDLEPLTVTGTVDVGEGQRAFTDLARAEDAGYFTRGFVTFTSGLNAGLSGEIKEHAAGGAFTLWPRMANPIAPGDTYSMTPGCTNLLASNGATKGCVAWDNVLRNGGFPHLPGGDGVSARGAR